VTIDNDPTDPADDPPVATYDWADVGRTVAAGSDFGGDGDTYLDMAILWDDLENAGMTPLTPIVTWAASSSTDNALDGDFACHDGGSGDPSLDAIGSDQTTVDPGGGGGADGGPTGTGETDLEGGGGCSISSTPASLAWLALLLLAALIATRRARSSRP
jgi:MYXO-CTERM domain-containing protein